MTGSLDFNDELLCSIRENNNVGQFCLMSDLNGVLYGYFYKIFFPSQIAKASYDLVFALRQVMTDFIPDFLHDGCGLYLHRFMEYLQNLQAYSLMHYIA